MDFMSAPVTRQPTQPIACIVNNGRSRLAPTKPDSSLAKLPTTMKTYCLGIVAAFALASYAFAAPFQFNSVTTYSQETPGSFVLSIGLVTHVQANLPMAIDLANVNEATSFRINANTMWNGTPFQVLLGQDPNYKPGATKAAISVPSGTVQLSWTATNLTFAGVLADNSSSAGFPGFPVPTPIPLGVAGPFTSNAT